MGVSPKPNDGKKFLSYMSEPKYPSNETESLVLPSSADLFRTYRSVLTQTLELIDNNANDSILTSLANFLVDGFKLTHKKFFFLYCCPTILKSRIS